MQPSLRGGTIGVFICKNSQWKIFQKLNKQNCHVCSSSLFLKAHSNKARNFHTRRGGSSISQSKFTHLISKPCSLFPFCFQGHRSRYIPMLHCSSPVRKEDGVCNSFHYVDVSLSLYSEKKKEGMTRDVGTQSTPPYISSHQKPSSGMHVCIGPNLVIIFCEWKLNMII